MNSFLATNPNDVEGKLYWGIILTRKGDVETAIKVFLELAEEHPTLAEPHNNLAVLYAAEGRYDEARQALITATKIRPEYDTAHENLGDLYGASIGCSTSILILKRDSSTITQLVW